MTRQVRQMEIGALVSIRGISRIKMVTLTQVRSPPFNQECDSPAHIQFPLNFYDISLNIWFSVDHTLYHRPTLIVLQSWVANIKTDG